MQDRITDAGVAYLEALPRLREIAIEGSPAVSGDNARVVSRACTREILRISATISPQKDKIRPHRFDVRRGNRRRPRGRRGPVAYIPF